MSLVISEVKGNAGSGGIYYGWIVVASAFVVMMVAWGVQFSFGIFFKPLQDTFGWSRATTSWAMTANLIVFALFMIPVGWAIDRFDTRVLYSGAAVLFGAALVLCSRITEPWQLYLLYGLPMGIGLTICGPVIFTIITRWFTEKRGLPLGIASTGVGFGTLGGAPLCNLLITNYGWRNAFVILGIASGIIFLVCAYFIRNAPRSAANNSRSVSRDSQKGNQALKPVLSQGMTFAQAVMTRAMLLIIVMQASTQFALRVVIVHLVPHAMDIGISSSAAALAVGTIGGVSIIGRLIMGFVQDRIGAQRSMIICIATQGIALLALPFIGSDLLFFVFAAVFGFTYGGDVPQIPVIVAQSFGLASMGVIYGFVATVGNFIGALAPTIAGYVFDVSGSYTTIFLGAAVGLFVGVLCIQKLKLPN